MAFNLMAAGKRVHFFLSAVSGKENIQSIYDSFSSRSKAFKECLERDLREILTQDPGCEMETGDFKLIPEKKLYTYSFLVALIANRSKIGRPLSRQDAVGYLSKIKKKDRPVIFIDEFPEFVDTKDLKNDDKLKFCRNIFRSLNLAVVLSGTNTSATNLVKKPLHSRSSDIAKHWCTVVPRFPSFVSQQPLSNYGETWEYILQNSRPLFSLLAKRFLDTVSIQDLLSVMDELNLHLSSQVRTVKRESGDNSLEDFLAGQVCLLLSASYCLTDGNNHETPLIHRHFALLKENKPFKLYLIGHGYLNTEAKSTWVPETVFPPVEKDILLYLTFMGGKNHYALAKSDPTDINRRPFAQAIRDLFSGGKIRNYFLNSNQKSNDGMRLEATVSGALILSSHQDGFSGTNIKKLLSGFFYEMDLTNSHPNPDVVVPNDLQSFMDIVVPFLSPPNQKWPERLLRGELNLGNFERTSNSKRLDFQACIGEYLVSGECKDHATPLSSTTLRDILERVPEKSRVHLVVTNRLAKDYFASKRKQDGSPKDEAPLERNFIVYRADYDGTSKNITLDTVSLNRLVLKKPSSPEQLIILIPLKKN